MNRPHPDVRDLLAEIHGFLARTRMTPSRFGVEALNDGHLLERLCAGREPRRATIEQIRAFMKRREPRHAAIKAAIERVIMKRNRRP